MIDHTREGCKFKGDGVHGAASEVNKVQQEAKSESAEIVKPKRGSKAKGDESLIMKPPCSCKSFYVHETYLFSSSHYFRTLLETAVGGLETEMSTVGKLRTIVNTIKTFRRSISSLPSLTPQFWSGQDG